jgi:SAM-dependent methyltransferase
MSRVAPEAQVWDLLRGALGTRALGLVADLDIAGRLAGGPRPVVELAAEADADPDALRRILRALASDGIFAEVEPGVFRNTDASDVLRRDGWGDFAHLFGGVWHSVAGRLDLSGEPAFPHAFGSNFWDWLADHPGERAAFDRAMEQGWQGRIDRLATVEWRGGETVVDVGGGNGSLLVELLQRQPGLRGIVFDLPETNRDEERLGERIEFVAGSFFERVPTGDVYILSTTLHNWDDVRAAAILRTVRAAAPPHGRLIVLDTVVPAGNEPHGVKWLDLLMLALLGGREREEAQWRELLARGGFEIVRMDEGLIEAKCL